MRAKIGLAALVLVPLALGTALWSFKRQRNHRLHPGKVEVVLVDAFGKPWPQPTTVRLGTQTLRSSSGTAGPFTVEPGAAPFFAHVTRTWGCGTSILEASRTPFPGGDFTVSVGGSPTDELQRLEVRLGLDLIDVQRERAADEYQRWKAKRSVSIEALWPDGGPAADAHVLCPNKEVERADRAGVVTCSAFIGEREASAGLDGLGGIVTIPAADDEATIVLERPGFALDVEVRGLVDAGHITLNSKETMSMAFSDSDHFEVPFVPLARTIVCSRVDAQQACDVVVLDGGTRYSMILTTAPPGTLEFQATLRGEPVLDPILYFDRAQYPPKGAATQAHVLARGRHVLVVNVKNGPERYETLFDIEPGKTTSLGVLPLAAP